MTPAALAPHTTRPCCTRCQRPASTCLCGWVRPTENAVPLLVLQHVREAGHAKGSLPLLHLSLAHCRVEVGERFQPQALQDWLQPGAALLYPGPRATPCTGFGTRPAQLVLLDGTWRQTRQLLHLNPLLQQLPRLQLADPPPSLYRMRKAQQATQRSTLEAACGALGALENRPEHFALLLRAFEAWADQQAARFRPQPQAPADGSP